MMVDVNISVKVLQASFLSADGLVIHDYGLSDIGVATLHRLLVIIESAKPEITYVPVCFKQSICMFIYKSDDYKALALSMSCFYEQNISAAYSMMKRRVGSSEETVLVRAVRDWPSWLFHHLPFDYAVRVVDCFVVEGHKMLLRVALAIIYIWSKKSKRHVRGDKKSVGGMHRVHSPPPTLYTSPFTSQIVSMEIATEIMAALPNRFQLETPKLLFRLSDDGSSFTQLWTKIDDAEQTLLGIQTSTGEVFGAYCSASWSERKDAHERTRSRYFGTGESFLWKVDNKTNKLTIYPWAGSQSGQRLIENCPQMFMAADEKCIVVGSGGGDAIAIRDELFKGISSPCATFASPALADDREFIISQLEVFDVRSGPT
ncbi:unnamed protein product [Anisakis simplex]|uniref:TLDc domain-containing protein n=1 Tax=Anisakis simplex TaxID=6269 RepID=A0A0M3K518_ANISI|nr:unnamed protein product [Anisakis simplex]